VKLAYLGNFGPPSSTENHVSASFELAGHEVVRVQEQEHVWADLPGIAMEHEVPLVVWTRTKGLDSDLDAMIVGLGKLRQAGIVTAGYHLDKWWDLPREEDIPLSPFFRCEHVCTADGGNQARFKALGINHHWLPPGVFGPEAETPGQYRDEFDADVAFVGTRYGYHTEWAHRGQLVAFLKDMGGVRFWPNRRRGGIRGPDLADLYASSRVVVGDSCMVGGTGWYWSDRVPETVGRGGFLLHPYTEGIEESYTDGTHLRLWELGDWGQLRSLIDYYVKADDERRQIAATGRQHVLDFHTYTHRVTEFLRLIGMEDGATQATPTEPGRAPATQERAGTAGTRLGSPMP
jgi:hypothetical protein